MKLANPAPLGLFGFALTTWLLSMVNARHMHLYLPIFFQPNCSV